MLNFKSDRLDYGELLKAPAGYRLELALATTFSLDLEALVAASLALGLGHTLEGELKGEKLALIESLDQLQDRLLVFYQRGNIKVPKNFNRLFTLLEPLLIPTVAMEGADEAFASFHPKIWLLHFSPLQKDQPARLRLLVLSRNLTFDRSWDIAVSLNGQVVSQGANPDPRLVDFLRSLSQEAQYLDRIKGLCASLHSVRWDLPDGFDELSMLPGAAAHEHAPASIPFQLEKRIQELLILSPFVDASPQSYLQKLAAQTTGSKTLISRADTLDAIGAEALQGWCVQVLSDQVIDGEERLELGKTPGYHLPKKQELHAKLVVAKVGSKAIWHVGSANMTNAALGQPLENTAPRNREFMLRLVGRDAKHGPEKLLEAWQKVGVFQPHEFSVQVSETQPDHRALRLLIHGLTSATWSLHVQRTEGTHLAVRLEISDLPTLPGDYKVTVSLLCRPSPRLLESSVAWDQVELVDLSAFVAVEVSSDIHQVNRRFVVQAAIVGESIEQRRQAIFNQVVGSGEKLVRYLTVLLDFRASKSDWLRADAGGTARDIFQLDGRGSLYEQLLRAAARAPEQLERACELYRRLQKDNVTLPPGLEDILEGFAALGEQAQ